MGSLRTRILPWLVLYELASIAGAEWRGLSSAERDKLTRLVVKSRGWPSNLSRRERAEVKRIITKVDLQRVAREIVPKVVGRGR
ncbi:MAG TPA: hypothetical protein VHW26_02590 [Solirubrobacteraceae bacterium]|jgi:hypothetical protein|nr:hypothetical protein [Solirubrobacteraceae bacterium]